MLADVDRFARVDDHSPQRAASPDGFSRHREHREGPRDVSTLVAETAPELPFVAHSSRV